MIFSLFVGKRYLIAKKSNNAINFITLISIISIAIGTASLVIILSAFNGLSGLIHSIYNSFNSDIKITNVYNKPFIQDSLFYGNIKQIEGVLGAYEVIEKNALLKFKDRQCVATVKGVSEQYIQSFGLDSLITEGSFNIKKEEANHVVLGKGIAYNLYTAEENLLALVSFYAPQNKLFSVNPEESFNEEKAAISGTFSVNEEFDFKYVFTSFNFAKKLFDFSNSITGIELKLKPGAKIESVKTKLKEMLGANFSVKDRYEQNEILYKTMSSEKLWTSIILLFILIVATFNISGTMGILLLEKKKDCTTLFALGADKKTIRNIFFAEGSLVVLIGTILGLIIGLGVCWAQISYGLIKFNEGFIVDYYPIKILLNDLAFICFSVITIGLIATYLPVRYFSLKFK